MNTFGRRQGNGFTLIEVLAALLILSILALLSYRGLGAVLETRQHVALETDKWRHVDNFLARFGQDVHMASPRPWRSVSGSTLAWRGVPTNAAATAAPQLEFSRASSGKGDDTPRRIAYTLNRKHQIELWLWPGLDLPPNVLPARYPVLSGVTSFDLQYLDSALVWVNAWPTSPGDTVIPRAVRLRIVLTSGEQVVRVFALNS